MVVMPIRIFITNKTYFQLKHYDFNFDIITKENIDYFVISNSKNIFYDKDNNKFYMLTKKNNKIWFDFNFSVIDFNEKFCNFIDNVYQKSIKELNKIFFTRNNNLYFQEKEKGSLLSGINSTIFKYSYQSYNYDVFDFVTEIFIKVLTGHYFIDGNKRTALMLLIQLLKNFGYYFYFSGDFNLFSHFYYWSIEKELANFVEMLQQNKVSHREIKKWIYSRIIIDLKF
ncbi:type II toxin-antitoxin system death-on-curing family toxin [Mycoplasma mycoides]|uniref:type II toxin-antitoxin system death-on-curing family toxin n=1 Tax=Mycoplasma mycoides TaxID=2102 RepID=UPI002733B219|nr:type II toxin-antitoxin system death-on-curing family toxin [Mycoplasma mycoides]MDP4040818.1 type II toxin-antitoxin system death-on-curing family toxin [Mycoplasma mycoides]MDP4041679.1 type II toxin-antitoxin system death-on-curing family toxin [Mycoplasma mycoides]MDP4042575.1 type II toxin-antitoxin system death-on-curing family toxin [Mycoplasma mycoides]MDP4044049.1 type II toxin-antitoxin system death-on-curing family toxin [Mycoplasma mycoides]MDP4044920.1 type II toxin-antitoxin s